MPVSNATDLEVLKKNEFFAKRWWELERLDYSQSHFLPLITVEELAALENRIIIDIRSFKDYSLCHMKGSFNMHPQAEQSELKTYINFAKAYQKVYPNNFMVLLGD